MKSRILFVDDETNILDGYRRALREKRGEWDMLFVDSGEKAVKFLQKFPIDVIVSDMRMPGMDGAQVLNKVRQVHPSAVRIILSGYAEEESVLRTVGPAHQYLAKPCEVSVIVDTIHRALGFRRILDNPDLRRLVSGLNHLPVPPAYYLRLLQQLSTPHYTVTEIADTIAEDIAMTAQTMKLTNSAYFALPSKIETLHHAVSMLGADTLKSLVLVAGFFKKFSGDSKVGVQIEELSQRCLSIGVATQAIATYEGLPTAEIDQANSAGVLTHIGTLTLLANWPDRFQQAVKLVEDEGLDIIAAERKIFAAAHPEIGAYLLGLWGFADPITEAVAYHHSPQQFTSNDKPSVLICVYAAQHLLKTVNDQDDDEANAKAVEGLDMDYLKDFGLEDRVPAWVDIVRNVKSKLEEGSAG